MGCFSFICKKSNEAVLSSSFDGDAVHLFLLKDGEVIEKMYGNYDSYGRVFKNTKDEGDTSRTESSSFSWKMKWIDVCDLIFNSNTQNGIAAILSPYWKEGDPYPTERSKDDPNQGWGEHGQLLGSISKEIGKKVDNPKHEVFY